MVKGLSDYMAAGALFAGELEVDTSVMSLTYYLPSEMTRASSRPTVCATHFSQGQTPVVERIFVITMTCIRQSVRQKASR